MRRYNCHHAGGLVERADGKLVRYEDWQHVRREILNIAAELASLMHEEGLPESVVIRLHKMSIGLRHLALPDQPEQENGR